MANYNHLRLHMMPSPQPWWWPMMRLLPPPPPQPPQMFVVPHLGPPPPPPARTHVVPFHEQQLVVTVAKDPLDVDRWIQGVCNIFWHSLNKLVVGLDTEWRPNLLKGVDHPVATLQLSVGQSCLIFQIYHAPRIPDSLRWFLSNPNFTFCGVGIKGDANKLYGRYGLAIGKTLDLHELFRDCYKGEYWHLSLKNMSSRVLGKDMKKLESVTLSAWDAYHLSDHQVEHAAVDAYVSFKIGYVLLHNSGRLI